MKPPIPRPNWRDPNMPVLFPIRQPDGTTTLESFPAEELAAAMKIWHAQNEQPDFRDDPTYNLRRKRR